MRIAIFTDTYVPDKNGIVTSIDHFTKLMADDGHQIMIFCPRCGRYKDKKYKNISIKRYISITTPSHKDMKLALPFIWTAVSDLKEFEADVVHIQTPLGIGWVGIWATKILKIKNIQTYHTYIPDFLVYIKPKTLLGINKITDYINGLKFAKASTRDDVSEGSYNSVIFKSSLDQITKDITENGTKGGGKFNERFGRNFTKAVYNRANLVLTPSKAMKKILEKQGVKVKIEVMSNGIDSDYFKKKTDYRIKNKILYTGRLGYEKNVDVVILAFDIALKTNPKLTLDIMGDGSSKKSLHNIVKGLGLSKKIKFWGAYDIDKVSGRFCEYDFFVTASTVETQGIAILEAMASGLPVLGVNELAIPEIIKDGENGYLSKPFDTKEMANNMLKMLESDEKLERFGKKSLEIAKTHEIVECKNRLLRIYERVIESE